MTTNPEGQAAIEAAAKALYEEKQQGQGAHWRDVPEPLKRSWRRAAQMVCQAWLDNLPDWKLVPCWPSMEMVQRGLEETIRREVWIAMVEAAPPPPGLEQPE